jgi:hypothetical protein
VSIQNDPPEDPPPDDDVEGEPADEELGYQFVGRRQFPEDDPRARVQRHYLQAGDLAEAPLLVTVAGGDVASDYAPANLIGKVTGLVSGLLRGLMGGYEPMFYGAIAGASMRLIFGDPVHEGLELQFPVDATEESAARVSRLFELDGDELLAAAIRLGEVAPQYSALVQLVESEDIIMSWRPRSQPERVLRPLHATTQRRVLSQPPPFTERQLTVNGILYRVITPDDDAEDARGGLGLRLFGWSARPSGHTRKGLLASYDSPEITRLINERGLLGKPVEAVLRIRTPKPGASVDPKWVRRDYIELREGRPEDELLGRLPFDVETEGYDDEEPEL